MTEEDWLACKKPGEMLAYLKGKRKTRPRERKMRLLACSWCRLLRGMNSLGASEAAIEVLERSADGRATEKERAEARDALDSPDGNMADAAVWAATAHGRNRVMEFVLSFMGSAFEGARKRTGGRSNADKAAGHILCDLFGNPFRPVAVDRCWLTDTVVSLAHSAYDERLLPSGELDPARLAVLSDALEEAGCDDATVLLHLRGPGPHVRGCWAVDLCVGKS